MVERWLTVVLSVVLSALVNWFLGPRQFIRQERARRKLDLCRQLRQPMQELLRRLRNEELQCQALIDRREGVIRWTIREYERLLWPVVRALDDGDLGQKLVERIRPVLVELLGNWRLEYLSICVTADLENAFDRYPIQARDVREGPSLIEQMCGRVGQLEPVTATISKVEEMLRLL
jgi:hypothetical protein